MSFRLKWTLADTAAIAIGLLLGAGITGGWLYGFQTEFINLISMIAAIGATYFAFKSAAIASTQFRLFILEREIQEVDLVLDGLSKAISYSKSSFSNPEFTLTEGGNKEACYRIQNVLRIGEYIDKGFLYAFYNYPRDMQVRNEKACKTLPIIERYCSQLLGHDWKNCLHTQTDLRKVLAEAEPEVRDYINNQKTRFLNKRIELNEKRESLLY